jgi:hypothetical protein
LPGSVKKMSDDRQYAPATLRNRDFILDVLPKTGLILEIASGSGEHVVHSARCFPRLVFQPSDLDPGARLSVAAWANATGVTNVRAPIALDASNPVWPIASAEGIICINMVHISPWKATLGLLKGAAAILPPASPLYLYGPYISEGFATAPSNQAFDQSLRDRDPNWGLRDLEAVAATAQALGFSGSGYHRNAGKQSKRGVPPNVIRVVARTGPASERLLSRGSSLGLSWQPGSDDRMPEERSEKNNHNNPKDKTPRVENRGGVVAGGQPVGIAHAKLLGRPPASQPHQTLIKIS